MCVAVVHILLLTYKSVSYTHLDVYKRQVLEYEIHPNAMNGCNGYERDFIDGCNAMEYGKYKIS